MKVFVSSDKDNQIITTQVVPSVYPDICGSTNPTCCGAFQYVLVNAATHAPYLVLNSPSTVYLNTTDTQSIGTHAVSLNISLVDYWQATAYIATFKAEVAECVVSSLTATQVPPIAFVIGETSPITVTMPDWVKDVACGGVSVVDAFSMLTSILGVTYFETRKALVVNPTEAADIGEYTLQYQGVLINSDGSTIMKRMQISLTISLPTTVT